MGLFLLILKLAFNYFICGKLVLKKGKNFEIKTCRRLQKHLSKRYGEDHVVVLHDSLFFSDIL